MTAVIDEYITERDTILNAIRAFVARKPALQPANYISSPFDYAGRSLYRKDARKISRDRRDAEILIRYVTQCNSITADRLLTAMVHTGQGRLSWGHGRIDYYAGQYYPTEYRAAVCDVLANAITTFFVDRCRADSTSRIRACAKREFERAIVTRWFT